MNIEILRKLKSWRDQTARGEKVDSFRVLSNKTIEDLATFEPKTKEELTNIKGIKDKKYYKYGNEILSIIKSATSFDDENDTSKNNSPNTLTWQERGLNIMNDNRTTNSSLKTIEKERLGLENKEKQGKIYSISEFLDFLNEKLQVAEVKVKGEVTSVDQREKVIYFNLKDKSDGSVINCLIFRYQYDISAVKFEIGDEIIVTGYPEIYKPMGKLSLKASLIEVAGEGSLKKAYDELKKKLEDEGLFAPERKKQLPELPKIIGLITSSQGAAIADFRINLGNYGLKIKFINSSVEGKQAVFDLISAVKRFGKMKNIDALAIIRGGGSLESLQAFNNEALIREIIKLDIPVICGVGHEKDVSLVSLVSDIAVSTPTAAARTIRESWDRALSGLNRNQIILINLFERQFQNQRHKFQNLSHDLRNRVERISYLFSETRNRFFLNFRKIEFSIKNSKEEVAFLTNKIFFEFEKNISLTKERIKYFENSFKIHNPERQLKLGYSIVSLNGKIIRSIRRVKKGDSINLKLSDGIIESEVKAIKKGD